MNDKKIVTFEQYCEYCIYHGIRPSTREHICTNLQSDEFGTISPDVCPLWKEIDNVAEDEKVLKDFARKFISEQKPLPPEAQKILDENLWDLI